MLDFDTDVNFDFWWFPSRTRCRGNLYISEIPHLRVFFSRQKQIKKKTICKQQSYFCSPPPVFCSVFQREKFQTKIFVFFLLKSIDLWRLSNSISFASCLHVVFRFYLNIVWKQNMWGHTIDGRVSLREKQKIASRPQILMWYFLFILTFIKYNSIDRTQSPKIKQPKITRQKKKKRGRHCGRREHLLSLYIWYFKPPSTITCLSFFDIFLPSNCGATAKATHGRRPTKKYISKGSLLNVCVSRK